MDAGAVRRMGAGKGVATVNDDKSDDSKVTGEVKKPAGHIVRVELDEKLLFNYGRRVNKPLYDDGYLIKGALCGAMGDEYRPAPYSIEPERGGRIPLLGYSKHTADELRKRIEQFGDPEAASVIDMKTLFSKPLPDEWPEMVGFSVRIWPYIASTVGMQSSSVREQREGKRTVVPSPPAPAVIRRERKVRARSIDYFQHCALTRPAITREEAYCEWLERKFEASGAELVEAQMIRFRHISACRGPKPGDGPRDESAMRMVRFSTADMAGILQVTDAKAFSQFLTMGISRQKFAGFGMVKVHPLH
jgi:hypothetical protein